MSEQQGRGSGPSIVGGQPQGGRGVVPATVTVGVERVLYEAATNPAFREALLAQRQAAVQELGVVLKPSEAAVLANVSDATLGAMINAIRVPDHRRRRFIQAVAAVSAGTAGAVLLDGCLYADTGARPDEDAYVGPSDGTVDASTMDDGAVVTGIRPAPPDPEAPPR